MLVGTESARHDPAAVPPHWRSVFFLKVLEGHSALQVLSVSLPKVPIVHKGTQRLFSRNKLPLQVKQSELVLPSQLSQVASQSAARNGFRQPGKPNAS